MVVSLSYVTVEVDPASGFDVRLRIAAKDDDDCGKDTT
jgi:hypothetical protein